MQIDNAPLLRPVDEQVPSGPNLEYTPEFQSLEELARPRQERALGAGVLVPDAPQWRQVAESAEHLLGRSKDLRLGILLSIARLHQDGLVGWSSGVGLLRQLLEQFWGDVHPHLDADEDNDPTERVNAIAALADSERTLTQLRNVRLFRDCIQDISRCAICASCKARSSSLRRTRARYQILPPSMPACATARWRRCLIWTQPWPLRRTTLPQLPACSPSALRGHGPELAPLTQDLDELRAFLRPYVSERSGSPAEPTEHAAPGADTVRTSTPRAHAVEHPDEVRRMLDQLCDYYARREPSSPVPLLLRRAQRLVGLDFTALIRDLAPRAIEELQVVSGQDHSD